MKSEQTILIEEARRFMRQRDEARKAGVDLFIAIWRSFFHDMDCPALDVAMNLRLPKDCACNAEPHEYDEGLRQAMEGFRDWTVDVGLQEHVGGDG